MFLSWCRYDLVRQLLVGGQKYTVELPVETVPQDKTAEALGEKHGLMTVVHLSKQGRSLSQSHTVFIQDNSDELCEG